MVIHVLKVAIIISNIHMNIMENAMIIVIMDFYMMIIIIKLMNVNVN